MRTGCRVMPRPRTVSAGSSARAVPAPTITASWRARMAWTARRAAGPVIHWLSPVAVAMRPSKLDGELERDARAAFADAQEEPGQVAGGLIGQHACGDRDPGRAQHGETRPETRGSSSCSGATTRAIPASINASAQGGVLP